MELNIHSPLPRRKDFRIGILGAGFIIDECHLPAYRKAGFNPAAIASRKRENAERVAKRYGVPKVHESYAQLLDDPTIEVLDIAVPPDSQFNLISEACQRKTVKGILAQKPLGMNYREAADAVAMCAQAGIVLAVNQNMRYDQSVRAAKTLLENGTIGPPVFATIEMRGIPRWMPWQARLGGATLRMMSIHHLDCFRYWFGEPEGIYCSMCKDPRTQFPHTDGICTYILEYPTSKNLRCVGIDDPWTGPAREGCPSDNYIKWRIEGLNGLAIGNIGWHKSPFTTPSTIQFAAKGDKEFQRPTWTESWFPDAFIGTMAQLLIALDTQTEPVISGRDNLKTMALVDLAFASAIQFRSMSLEEFAPLPRDEKKPPGFLKRLFSSGAGQTSGSGSTLNNFTPRAQQALAMARKEADRFNHNFVGTEHLLLGLIKLGQGVAVNVLQKRGLDLETVRREVEKQIGPGPDQKMIGNIPYTPRVKKVLALAAKEAKALSHTYVGTEHILLGLMREGDGVAARVLKNLNVDIEQTRQEILRELDPNFAPNMDRGTSSNLARPIIEHEMIAMPSAESVAQFTPRAQQALAFAGKEATLLNHNFVGTEHILLGLITLGQGVSVTVLQKLGLDLEKVRDEVKKQAPAPDPKTTGKIAYTPDFKKTLALAAKEARALGHAYVGTEHILLGLLREGGTAARIMKNLGVNAEQTRLEILRELDPNNPR
jgi:predicted dehydrogenase